MSNKPGKHSKTSARGKREKLYLFDKPKNVQRLLRGFYLCCTLLVLAEFIIHRHVAHPWEGLYAFYAFYGFVACVVLVLAATQLRKLIMRDEDYYDSDPDTGPDSHADVVNTLNANNDGGNGNVGH